jgi:hypothetical protein
MFLGSLLREGVLRRFKHPSIPVAVDLTEFGYPGGYYLVPVVPK